MVRISSFGQQQLLVNGLFRNQGSIAEAQQQITTGKKHDEFRGLAGDTATALGSRTVKNRIDAYQDNILAVRGRLEANDVQIGGLISASESLQDSILAAISSNSAEGFSEKLDSTFSVLMNTLNTNIDGVYLFSGTSSGQEPMPLSSLADLQAMTGITTPTVTNADVQPAFENSPQAFKARIADGVDVEFGLLANEVAGEIFTVMHNLYNYDQDPATGPLQKELTPAQFQYLQDELQNLDAAIKGMRQHEVSNGLIFERMEVVDDQHEETKIFLETFISDIEDVDLAEAITRLNNDQVALEASFRAVSTLNNLTLLQFI